jgi:hypothetical protein
LRALSQRCVETGLLRHDYLVRDPKEATPWCAGVGAGPGWATGRATLSVRRVRDGREPPERRTCILCCRAASLSPCPIIPLLPDTPCSSDLTIACLWRSRRYNISANHRGPSFLHSSPTPRPRPQHSSLYAAARHLPPRRHRLGAPCFCVKHQADSPLSIAAWRPR